LASGGDEIEWEALMSSDHEAFDPLGLVRWIECEAAGALKQHRQNYPCLQAGQRSADAVVDATPKCHVAPGHWAVQHDVIGMVEYRRISVGGGP
jgi:hypothetical protein